MTLTLDDLQQRAEALLAHGNPHDRLSLSPDVVLRLVAIAKAAVTYAADPRDVGPFGVYSDEERALFAAVEGV